MLMPLIPPTIHDFRQSRVVRIALQSRVWCLFGDGLLGARGGGGESCCSLRGLSGMRIIDVLWEEVFGSCAGDVGGVREESLAGVADAAVEEEVMEVVMLSFSV